MVRWRLLGQRRGASRASRASSSRPAGSGPGQRALDVAAGDGNVALAIAASGASPEACDLAPALVAAGKARCDALGEWEIPWVVADAEALPFADRPLRRGAVGLRARLRAAAGGRDRRGVPRHALGRHASASQAWTPGSAAARFGDVAAKYFPASEDPPPPPHLWGDEETCRARLAPHAVDVSFELRRRHVGVAVGGRRARGGRGVQPLRRGGRARRCRRSAT